MQGRGLVAERASDEHFIAVKRSSETCRSCLELEPELEARHIVSKVSAISTPSLLPSGESDTQFPHL